MVGTTGWGAVGWTCTSASASPRANEDFRPFTRTQAGKQRWCQLKAGESRAHGGERGGARKSLETQYPVTETLNAGTTLGQTFPLKKKYYFTTKVADRHGGTLRTRRHVGGRWKCLCPSMAGQPLFLSRGVSSLCDVLNRSYRKEILLQISF